MNVCNMCDVQKHCVPGVPLTAYYISEFISREEENNILSNIYSVPKPKWTQLSNRRLQNWGGVPHSNGMIAETIPHWLAIYLDKIHELNVMGGRKPNHILINEYLPGQGIMPHLDGSLFYPTITTISLGSHTVLKFLESTTKGDKMTLKSLFSLVLEPRSLLILQNDLFEKYLHGIEEKKEDYLDENICNLSMCSSDYALFKTVQRDTRLSLTIRHVPRTTVFKINIGI